MILRGWMRSLAAATVAIFATLGIATAASATVTIGPSFNFPTNTGSERPFHVHTIGDTVGPVNALAFVETHGVSGAAAPVYKFDAATNAFGASVLATSEPMGLATSPDRSTLYITTYGNGSTASGIDVVRISDMTRVASIPLLFSPVGSPENISAGNLLISPDGVRAYVLGQSDDALHVVNLVTRVEEDVQSLGVGSYFGTGDGTDQIAMSPDGSKLFITQHMNAGGYTVSRVQVVATNDIHHPHTLNAMASGADFNQPTGVTISPDGTRLFISSFAANEVLVFDPRTETYIGKVAVTSPTWVTVSPESSQFVVSSGDDLLVFNTATTALLQTLSFDPSAAPQQASYTLDGVKLIVALHDFSQLAVLTVDPPLPSPVLAKAALAATGQNFAPMALTAGILIVLGVGAAVGVAIKRRKRP